jgi:pimeloyl-ACP methyl ester carboxylesterase
LRILVAILILKFIFLNIRGQEEKKVIYLIPGQGSDYRLYDNLNIDKAYDVRYIHHCTPVEGTSMREYALELSYQIDTNNPYIIIGVSLGGMLATEMADFLNPEKVIVISSAKCRDELPGRYRFQKSVPLYKLVSGNVSKKGALFLQPLVEPDSKNEEEIFQSMLENKDPDFLKRTIAMIMEWERSQYNKCIIHIHGTKDRTIPIRRINYSYIIEGGSHMMVLTRGDEISKLVNEVLLNP